MTPKAIVQEISNAIPQELAEDIVDSFMSIRLDASNNVLERSSPGKFVETIVQILQYLDTGSYSVSFKAGQIDDYLKNAESRPHDLSPNLKLVVTRVARAMYSLRNTRGIIHKGEINPNAFDLRFLYYTSQWILSEIIRHLLKTEIEKVGELIEYVQVPLATNVEDFGDRRLVLPDLTVKSEILVLLHHYYPNRTAVSQLRLDMRLRTPKTVMNTLPSLRKSKLIEGDSQRGYKLTHLGFQEVLSVLKGSLFTDN